MEELGGPSVSVVSATRNRSRRLARMLEALRAQTLASDRFEVIVVDDGSTDDTAEVLAAEQERGELDLRVVRREAAGGRAAARNAGWPLARAPLVCFTDDDCRPEPGWLEAMLAAVEDHAPQEVVVQGWIKPDPEEVPLLGPRSRSLGNDGLDGWFPTANIAYPRDLLAWLGGFDEDAFPRYGGEDTDLGWRATYHGVPIVFCREALVHHAVEVITLPDRLRLAARWSDTMANFARHPELRRVALIRGVFWKEAHYHLVRLLAALALPRPLRWVSLYFGWMYLKLLRLRAADGSDGCGGGPPMIPLYALEDLVEVAAVARGALRHRTVVL